MTPAEFKTLMPAFEGVADQDIQRWITRAAPYFDVGRWADLYSDGLSYFVAHKLVLEGAPGIPDVAIAGATLATKKTVGRMSVEYSDALMEMVAEEPFKATSFGREYLSLRNEVGRGAVSV